MKHSFKVEKVQHSQIMPLEEVVTPVQKAVYVLHFLLPVLISGVQRQSSKLPSAQVDSNLLGSNVVVFLLPCAGADEGK